MKTICRKIRNRCAAGWSELIWRISAREMKDANFLRQAWGPKHVFRDSHALASYFRNRSEPRILSNSFAAEYKELSDSPPAGFFFDKLIREADRICRHRFRLLGSDTLDLGPAINWHCDFKSGYCWNRRRYYKNIRIPSGKADIKVPWELSRFHHATVLGHAYCITSDEKYAGELVRQIDSWIEANPPGAGVNWRCTMDAAIRVSNWILGYRYVKASRRVTDDFMVKFLKSVYLHAVHIKDNLEWNAGRTSNHYLADLAGLFHVVAFFREFAEAEQWRRFCIAGLVAEMRKQVYPDGCDFEASTCYHRLGLEFFFFPALLAAAGQGDGDAVAYREAAESVFGREYVEKLYRMFDAVFHLLKPNGMMPQIGDNDSGRYIRLNQDEVLDMRYLPALGAVFFKEPKWKIREFCTSGEGAIEMTVVYGKAGRRIWDSMPWRSLKDIEPKAFPDAGWYVMRSGRAFCIVSCNSGNRRTNTAHCHSDKLSFELCIEGRDFIVDPGTCVYTALPDWRNKFRSAAYHNTVVIDGEEQYIYSRKNVFTSRGCSQASCTEWNCDEKQQLFRGEHRKCSGKGEAITHIREIHSGGTCGSWEIVDSFSRDDSQTKDVRPAEHLFHWRFHLHPDVRVNVPGDASVIMKNEDVGLEFAVNSDLPLRLDVTDSWYSPEYGKKAPAKCIELIYRGANLPGVRFDISAIDT